jgi:DNA-binding transcriptional ArsR family regulator
MVQYTPDLDTGFAAVADPTRRGILERLRTDNASISELSDAFGMTLTGVKKHVRILEDAGLVATEKVGRTRVCRLGPSGLERERAWMDRHRKAWEERFERLATLLDEMKGDQS